MTLNNVGVWDIEPSHSQKPMYNISLPPNVTYRHPSVSTQYWLQGPSNSQQKIKYTVFNCQQVEFVDMKLWDTESWPRIFWGEENPPIRRSAHFKPVVQGSTVSNLVWDMNYFVNLKWTPIDKKHVISGVVSRYSW